MLLLLPMFDGLLILFYGICTLIMEQPHTMRLPTAFQSLDVVAAKLPFHINDSDMANAVYKRWKDGEADAKQLVDLWTYCYIRRYFIGKFIQHPTYDCVDFDALVGRTYTKVQTRQCTIHDPGRYASWISVVCKNTFRNYLRTQGKAVSLDIIPLQIPLSWSEEPVDETDVMFQALTSAIDRLPAFLQEVARLRFLEECSYEEISKILERPRPIIRSYVNKVLNRLRSDPKLLHYLEGAEGVPA